MMLELSAAFCLGLGLGAWIASNIWRSFCISLGVRIIQKERNEKVGDNNNVASSTVEEKTVGSSSANRRHSIH